MGGKIVECIRVRRSDDHVDLDHDGTCCQGRRRGAQARN